VRRIAGLAVLLSSGALGAPPSTGHAHMNYILNCMGCHGADGMGVPGRIPSFPDSIGRFMRLPEGRAYLMHVPGASNSVLSDAELADVLNWLLIRFGADDLPNDVAWFTAEDLSRGRRPALTAVRAERQAVVARLAASGPAPAPDY
jgi:hypothetical protein